MENKTRDIWKALAFLFIFLVLVYAALWFLSDFMKSELVAAVLTGAIGIITASYQYRQAKKRETEARLFSDKREIYTQLTETIMNGFNTKKGDDQRISNEEFVKRIKTIRTKLIVWGSHNTIKALDQMGDGKDTKIMTENLGSLFEHMRKDLGHKDPKGLGVEIALGVMKHEDRAKIREEWKI